MLFLISLFFISICTKSLFSNELIYFTTPVSFHNAAKYLPILLISSAFASFCGFYGAFYLKEKRTRKIFSTTFIGSIINIASDLAIQAPDQRVYSKTNNIEDVRHFKPIGYPIVKSSMLGLNRYLASYWAHKGVRVNCLVPGAVISTQSEDLIRQIKTRVPLNRLAKTHEYQDAIVFLASNASSYMTGSELIVDGGRSIW